VIAHVLVVGLLLRLPVKSEEAPSLEMGRVTGPIRVDGVLDEPDWQSAPRISELVMIEPVEGGKPTGRTIVRVLAEPSAIVFGFVCEDPDPAGIVSFTKERDGDLDEEDHVKIVLDYANRLRQTYRPEVETDPPGTEGQAVEATPKRTLSKLWRDLIYRIFEVDPLTCSRCGARMKILAFIIDPKVIRQILDHLDNRARPRAPPDLSRKP